MVAKIQYVGFVHKYSRFSVCQMEQVYTVRHGRYIQQPAAMMLMSRVVMCPQCFLTVQMSIVMVMVSCYHISTLHMELSAHIQHSLCLLVVSVMLCDCEHQMNIGYLLSVYSI